MPLGFTFDTPRHLLARSMAGCRFPSFAALDPDHRRRDLAFLRGVPTGARVRRRCARASAGASGQNVRRIADKVTKSRNAIAIADGGRGGEVRYLGEFPATEAAIRKLVAKLAAKYRHLTFCYEAGPTGYGLYRLLKSLGHECLVVAPSLVPKKAGDRVKTNRRDAVSLAKLLRAGEAHRGVGAGRAA